MCNRPAAALHMGALAGDIQHDCYKLVLDPRLATQKDRAALLHSTIVKLLANSWMHLDTWISTYMKTFRTCQTNPHWVLQQTLPNKLILE
jgi:hypothetical protein